MVQDYLKAAEGIIVLLSKAMLWLRPTWIKCTSKAWPKTLIKAARLIRTEKESERKKEKKMRKSSGEHIRLIKKESDSEYYCRKDNFLP